MGGSSAGDHDLPPPAREDQVPHHQQQGLGLAESVFQCAAILSEDPVWAVRQAVVSELTSLADLDLEQTQKQTIRD